MLPYALDKLIRLHRRAEAADISKQISDTKAEIIQNNRRRDALKELREGTEQFKEEQQKMKQEERNIIRDNVKNRINRKKHNTGQCKKSNQYHSGGKQGFFKLHRLHQSKRNQRDTTNL